MWSFWEIYLENIINFFKSFASVTNLNNELQNKFEAISNLSNVDLLKNIFEAILNPLNLDSYKAFLK